MDLFYPNDLSNIERNPAWIKFRFFERSSPKESSPLDTVSLYMPESISQPSTVSWDTEKLGFVGNALAVGARHYKENGDVAAALGAATAATEGAGDLAIAKALSNLGAAAAGLLGSQVSAEALMGTVAGKIPNPYLTMVFRGIDFRNFSFVFKFYPYDEKDCDTIFQIINTFRANALPEYESGKAFLGYPAECEIAYQWLDKENPWMHKFKRSVCTAVDVDYTTTGMFSVMRNGFPSCITMATKWSEIELVTRTDIARDRDSIGTDKGY